MPKGQKKHIDKEQGKTKREAPRSVNYIATQNKNNIGTTALERSVVYTTGVFKSGEAVQVVPPFRMIALCVIKIDAQTISCTCSMYFFVWHATCYWQK